MSDIGESPTTTAAAARNEKRFFRSPLKRSQKSSIIQAGNGSLQSIPDDPSAVSGHTTNEFFHESSITINREREKEFSQGNSTKVFMVLGIFLLLIAGFWGRSSASLLGIPVDPAPYSALYFEDPHLATTGVKPGSLVAFGILNGSSSDKNFNWEAKVESRLLKKGNVRLGPHQRITLNVKVTGGKPMDFVRISVNTLDSPIVAVVTA